MPIDLVLLDPNTRLRLPELRRYIPLSEQRIRQLVAIGKLARPERIGLRAVAWRARDVLAYLDNLAREDAERRAGIKGRRGPAPKALASRAVTTN